MYRAISSLRPKPIIRKQKREWGGTKEFSVGSFDLGPATGRKQFIGFKKCQFNIFWPNIVFATIIPVKHVRFQSIRISCSHRHAMYDYLEEGVELILKTTMFQQCLLFDVARMGETGRERRRKLREESRRT
jgi:hypothetical protein